MEFVQEQLAVRAAIYGFASPLIIPVIQLIKGMGLPTKWAAPMAVLLGLIVGLLGVVIIPNPPQHWAMTALIGLSIGLAASGLYSGVRALSRPEPPSVSG
jgi:hypothetical protein